ncbi:Rne/Rng family ribonuclease [Nocardioides sp.]|uniref:Rne/Rng family ribonuclease n=1 Tax=Nocardioides sp. TaxID=35761 RepID=UPI002D7F97B0|nr:Rne/Rng family ribonuclease [Nocardioides sp.]HET8960530.1 Rne/Rng family ribonuclease [Nocardioides sp.]
MLEDHQPSDNPGSGPGDAPGDIPAAAGTEPAAKKTAARKTTAKKTAAKKTAARKTTTRKTAAGADEPQAATGDASSPELFETQGPAAQEPPAEPAAKKTAAARKSTAAKKTAAKKTSAKKSPATKPEVDEVAPSGAGESAASTPAVLFQAPDVAQAPPRRTRKATSAQQDTTEEKPAREKADRSGDKPGKDTSPGDSGKAKGEDKGDAKGEDKPDKGGRADQADRPDQSDTDADDSEGGGGRRRRRRGGRRRRKSGEGDSEATGQDEAESAEGSDSDDAEGEGEGGSSRRRRRRRRAGDEGDSGGDDPANTVTKVRQGRSAEDQITAVSGSTRLEAKKQRRREGREAGRRRAPIVSEAEFLARREAVERVMVIRQREELTQIAVLEDKVLVEHYVARESQTSLIGNVYLGRVQNVLPSMEAAFIDIGKGRNAVLYAGEVNWSALGHKDGQPRKIESVLSSGQSVLVQVTKDPVGHKGARLTSQISLAGRFLVYVPDGTTSGISRKLPDTERTRLKTLLKEIVPDSAGVIVRTAAEGASEDELTRDVERLKARWEDIDSKAKGKSPQALYSEPDLTLKVVRDLFTEDFKKLVVEGDDAWETVQQYVAHVAPDLEDRLERYEGEAGAFSTYRIDEQIAKGLDRKVWLPSGGSLIIDRTEAMTVVDVNTGKFTGSGGNLEETVTKNNLEAAEELVRQLRLRDIGGIIVVDFIDMVLESNRDLVLRRLVECLGRDRTRHQVAEVTSLGLVQMTRKRIGTGLLEAFSENCEACQGRGVILHDVPVEPKKTDDDSRRGGRRGKGRGRGDDNRGGGNNGGNGSPKAAPSPKDIAAMARPEAAESTESEAPQAGSPEPQRGTAPQPETPEPKSAPEAETPEPGAPEQRTAEPGTAEKARKPAPEESKAPEPETPEPKAVEAGAEESASRGTVEVPPLPKAEPAEEVPSSAPQDPPEKPKVVTRTRRRSASRPAGPPSAAAEPEASPRTAQAGQPVGTTGQVGAPAATGQVEPGTVDAEPGTTASVTTVEHVPIKKKGSRKR